VPVPAFFLINSCTSGDILEAGSVPAFLINYFELPTTFLETADTSMNHFFDAENQLINDFALPVMPTAHEFPEKLAIKSGRHELCVIIIVDLHEARWNTALNVGYTVVVDCVKSVSNVPNVIVAIGDYLLTFSKTISPFAE